MILRKREDVFAWIISVIFLILLIIAIFIGGALRGWDAESGYTHNTSKTSSKRFWPEPFTPEPGVKNRYGKDAVARWYYWRLPPPEVRWYTQLFPWLCFTAHLVTVWMSIYLAQKAKCERRLKYDTILSKYQMIPLSLNAFFHLLHFLQTHLTYDALAQDVAVSSSQSSVIAIGIFIFAIEYQERGLFFGWPSNYSTWLFAEKIKKLSKDPMKLIRKYHGYGFAWGAIYTFWYHPMENTIGHVTGFTHTYIILLQGCLAFTNVHLNQYWRFIVETWVTLHGPIVAYQTGGPDLKSTRLWPMFAFGFLICVTVTQLYGLPFWRRIPTLCRAIPPLILLAIILWCYSWIPNDKGQTWVRITEVIFIPATYWLYFIFVYILLRVLLKLDSISTNLTRRIPLVLLVTAIALIYIVMIIISYLYLYLGVVMAAFLMMVVLITIFVPLECITMVLFKNLFDFAKEKLKLSSSEKTHAGDEEKSSESSQQSKYGSVETLQQSVETKFK